MCVFIQHGCVCMYICTCECECFVTDHCYNAPALDDSLILLPQSKHDICLSTIFSIKGHSKGKCLSEKSIKDSVRLDGEQIHTFYYYLY